MAETVVLATDSIWTRVIVNALRRRFGDVRVILEKKEPVAQFLRRRIRRLGPMTVIGQLAFILVSRILRAFYERKERIFLRAADLHAEPISDAILVDSVNEASTIALLQSLKPKVVVVSQTRILARRVLEEVSAVFVNIHTGITPQYRGLHGGYWALANGDPENCGVTVHRIDAGVDTGPIIAQSRIKPPPSANYFTYHWYQLVAALPMLLKAVEDELAGKLATSTAEDGASRQYYHPTLWGYLWTGWRHKVW